MQVEHENTEVKEEFKPLIVAFCCNWCSYAGADLAFQRGADGVILCGCHPGDCHYSTGNYYARRRMTMLFSLLDYIGVEKGRTRVEWVSAAEGVKFAATMNEFIEKIRSLGKNVRLEDLRCRK